MTLKQASTLGGG